MTRHVSIESHGSRGIVTCYEAGHRFPCHREFGGGQTVVIVQCGNDLRWVQFPWAQARSLPRPWGNSPLAPKPEHHLAAGLMTSPTAWLGLHSEAEAARSFRPSQWLRPVVQAENAKQLRRFHVGQLEFDIITGYQRIASMRTVDDADYLNAAFLRPGSTATPIRMDNPAGALMLFTSAPGLNQTAILARVDDQGKVLWRADIGIDRFALQQILPGEHTTAFIGPRPPVPNKVSEPLLVIIEHDSGRQVTHSLWQ